MVSVDVAFIHVDPGTTIVINIDYAIMVDIQPIEVFMDDDIYGNHVVKMD